MPTPSRYYSSTAAKTTLSNAIAANSATLELAAASNLPSLYPYTLILEKDTANEEIVEVTGLVGTAYQINRNIDGSGAKAHSIGATVEHGVSARDFTESRAHEIATTAHGVSGAIVGTTDTQTLTNKTITGATITGLSSVGMVDSSAAPKNYVDSILGSAIAASTSAASAATSASSALTSQSSAATSASSAATSAASALTSQSSAATSASSALTSQTSAATSATSAAGSATAAATSATSAAASATAANSSAVTAAASVAAISGYASAAATSEANALTSANSAATSASSAATSAASALTSQSSAATSVTSAAGSATAAATSAASALVSQTAAATSAASAATSASSAATSVASAATSVASAATSASSALGSQNQAFTSAASAATSAASAEASKNTAYDWAVKMNGPVDGSEYSAKYYASQANSQNAVNKQTFEVKGDLLAGTGAGTYDNVPAGSDGQVLTANASSATGLSWTTPVTSYVALSGSTMSGELILSTTTPSTSLAAASKQYVDDLIQGLTWKEAVNLFADSNKALSGSTGGIDADGHDLDASTNGYRILLTAQSTPSENGIYIYSDSGSGYTLTRATDADVYTELIGASVYVQEGSLYGKTTWVQGNHYLTSFSGQNWSQTSGPGTYTGTAPISVVGTAISLDTSGVTAGTYTAATITVDDKGRVTSASTGSTLPSQSGNQGKYLTTDGSSASWAAVNASGPIVLGLMGAY